MNLPQREGAVQEREAGAKHRRTQTLRGTLARGPPAELPAAETEGKEGKKKKKKKPSRSQQQPSWSSLGAGAGQGRMWCPSRKHPPATYITTFTSLGPPPGFGCPSSGRGVERSPRVHTTRRIEFRSGLRGWAPAAARGREVGSGKGDGSGRAAGPSAAPRPCPGFPGSSPAARPGRRSRLLALPRVRSSGTFSSPLSFRPARNRHTTPIRIRSQASGSCPGSGQRSGSLPPPRVRGRQAPGLRAPGSKERGLRRAYLVFGGS
jgi:hypothetical protein